MSQPIVPMPVDVQAAFRAEFNALLARYGYSSGAVVMLANLTLQEHGLSLPVGAAEFVISDGQAKPGKGFPQFIIQGALIGVNTACEEFRAAQMKCTCSKCRPLN